VSTISANAVIPSQPLIPSPPLIGTITQPTKVTPTGSVELDGLPDNGTWTLTLTPGNVTTTGIGTTKIISGLTAGTYSFTVTNSSGCASGPSASFGIFSSTGDPVVIITNPDPVCFPSTADLTDPKITAGSTSNLTFTYWTDASATILFETPSAAPDGTYYIKGTTADGFFTIKPVIVRVYSKPVANAGPDQVLANKFVTTMGAQLENSFETGVWSLISGTADFSDISLPTTEVSGLSDGKNLFLWTVTDGVCPSSSDTIAINVGNLILPTLITPNMDGKNDYFVIKSSDTQGKMNLIIFDRRGVQVYKNSNYDNSWDGVDYKGKILPDDTYFFILKTENGLSASGFIVVRR
jgi:gliding motility-associated-like protein